MTEEVEYVPWVCPRCGYGKDESILARPKTVIRCICGHRSWSS